jgi:hypothetical protein
MDEPSRRCAQAPERRPSVRVLCIRRSPDGQEIVVVSSDLLSILYPNGSCLFCGMEAYVPGAATGTSYAPGSITSTAQPAFRTDEVLSINNNGHNRNVGGECIS